MSEHPGNLINKPKYSLTFYTKVSPWSGQRRDKSDVKRGLGSLPAALLVDINSVFSPRTEQERKEQDGAVFIIQTERV